MNQPFNIQTVPSAMLLQDFRDMCLAFGADHSRKDLLAKIDLYQAEIDRRISWG